MMENTCRSCGGILERVGNYNLCKFCGNKWMIDVSDDIRAVDRANAWSALRECDFEKATELFENIILKEKDCHESYWGRALAMAGIIYVNDMSEMKKVPTCNSISEDSFLECRDVKKAIELAPAEIAETYKKQAEQIEKIRVEWLEKARREPPYDVFISFKDSDRDKGIERTQDSVDAQDLYNGLVAEGFKVFFSRISLRNKVSEQYEPYIYNAIKTAKVMVVFGESPEYFNAVWIKNEWGRFKNRIEKGEKHKNSLVVAYKNMNPADLPISLRSRQCLNAAEMTFLPDLVRHIKRVIAETKQDAHLDRVEIKGGQISKKATKIANDTITTREIGGGAVAETDISEKQQLDLAKAYMRNKEWDDAAKLLDDLLFSNPTYAEALWCALMNKHCVTTDTALLKRFSSFDEDDFAYVEKVLNCADKSFAAGILDMLYLSDSDIDRSTYLRVIDVILPYNYEHRNSRIKEIFKNSTLNDDYPLFKKMLSTLNDEDVDDYIEYNLQYAGLTKNIQYERECLEAVLSVDEGNIAALKQILDIDWSIADKAHLVGFLEKILMYSASPDDEIISFIRDIESSVETKVHCEVVKEALRFYGGELADIKNALIDLAYSILDNELFDEAEYFLNLALSVDPKNPRIYWGICLVKTRSMNEKAIVYSPVSIKTVPEYNKYLTMVDDKRRQECMAIAKRQTGIIEGRKKAKKAWGFTAIVAAILVLVIAATAIITAIGQDIKYQDAVALMNEGKYAEAAVIFEDIAEYNDSSDKLEICKSEIEKSEKYNEALALMNKEKYAEAITVFNSILEYRDSKEKISECDKNIKYNNALFMMHEGKYTEAIAAFEAMNGYKDSVDKIDACRDAMYLQAESLMAEGKYVEAISAFEAMNGYKDSANKISECETAIKNTSYEKALSLMSEGKYVEAIAAFEAMNGYKDSVDKIDACRNAMYLQAESLMAEGKYVEAIAAFEAMNGYKDSAAKITECEIAINDIYLVAKSLMSEGKYADAKSLFLKLGDIIDASALIEECEGYLSLSYKLIDDEYKVTGFNSNSEAVTVLNIPAIYEGKPVTSIGISAFYDCDSLTSIVIPEGVTSIGDYAFFSCSSLTSIVIPEGVTSIGNYAFYGCHSLTSIVIPDSVTSISDYAFYGCYNLTSIVIPEGVTSIGDYAFYGCRSLTSIVIPDSVTSIGYSAFYDCDSLISIVISEGVTSIGNYAFGSCSSLEIVCYAGTKEEWVKISIGSNNDYLKNVIYNYLPGEDLYEKAMLLMTEGKYAAAIVAFKAMKDYKDSAAKITECESFLSLSYTLLNNNQYQVKGLSENAIESTNIIIPSIYEGKPVTSIGNYAFEDCSSLTSIVIPEGVTSIGERAFNLCSSLTSIVIPEGVTSIGDWAFYSCDSLTSIVIPESVTSVGYAAFTSCSSLKTVYYTGSEKKWAKIIIDSNNNYLKNANIVYNYVPEE